MIMKEEHKCNSSMELLKRERYWIETLKATLNNNVPFRFSKELFFWICAHFIKGKVFIKPPILGIKKDR